MWDQRLALKELRGLEVEVILPADKGNATVMMKRCDYQGTLDEMLRTDTYGQLKGNPTTPQERRLSHKLKGLEKNGETTMYSTIGSGQEERNPLGFMPF